MKGLFSAKVPNSSCAEVHGVLLTEPTHMEVEDQENEKEDERDCGESKSIKTTPCGGCIDDERARHLSQCHVRH